MQTLLAFLAAGAAGLGTGAARRRLLTSRAKHRSLTGHARLSRRIARLIPAIDYDEARFFAADGAPAEVVARRRAGFERLAATFAERFPRTRALTAEARESLSDLQFTSIYRVPAPFSRIVGARLGLGAFLARSEGVTVTDLDGNAFYDLTGSYGVNLLGTDAYKAMIRGAVEDAEALGPVLGGYHPALADNLRRLRAISGMDEVSFHMSGTEAVMQAVRLARYHTGRTRIVRFCGAYHGWWGEVQPGIGNPVAAERTLTFADMDPNSLRAIAARRDVACVLVNPLQALHPNKGAPADSALLDGSRDAGLDRAAYAAWLQELAALCRARGIVLILDEVFTGFRLARGGAAEYFGVTPDLVTYGKTLGGGLPVGVLCGRAALMKRFRPERPADICFARGTFNAHPYVMTAMNRFLRHLDRPDVAALYDGLDACWDARAARMNQALERAGVPVRVAHLSTIWTVLFPAPARYHWLLQYYLRAEGLLLSWVGSGRLIFSLAWRDADFAELVARFVRAAEAMRADGWFWHPADASDRAIRRSLLRDAVARRLGR